MRSAGRYKMGSFARLTGLSAAVLRAWERRYALLEPERLPGGHRMYTEDDLSVIRCVKELLDTGRSIGEVALRGRRALLDDGVAGNTFAAIETESLDRALVRLSNSVVRAAVELDGDLLRGTLDEAFARVAPRVAVERVVEPAARQIGARWARDELSVAGEHLVSSHLVFRLNHLLETANALGRGERGVLCACLPGEHHQLGLLTVALHLASSGHHLTYLGPDLPYQDLQRACESVQPLAVCLSVTRPELFQRCAEGLGSFARRSAGDWAVYLGGAGVPDSDSTLERAGVRLFPPGQDLEALLEALALKRRSQQGRSRVIH